MPDTEKRIVICSSDLTNPARQSYRRGEEAFAAVCEKIGVVQSRVLPFHSEFSRLRTRGPGDGPIQMDWWKAATAAVVEMSEGCDFIATDNPWGFYSHGDHLLVRRMVLSSGVDLPVRWSDLFWTTTTWPQGSLSRQMRQCRLFAEKIGEYKMDTPLFEELRQQYVSRGAWTWDHPVQGIVNIYEERC